MASPFIGSAISLISKKDIRYEGVLYTIDTKDSTLALQSVRSFGTEGRRENGPQIPASKEVYDFIVFRAHDIKDLKVLTSEDKASAAPAGASSTAPVSQPPPQQPAASDAGSGAPTYAGASKGAAKPSSAKPLPGDLLPPKPAATIQVKPKGEKKAWTGKHLSEQGIVGDGRHDAPSHHDAQPRNGGGRGANSRGGRNARRDHGHDRQRDNGSGREAAHGGYGGGLDAHISIPSGEFDFDKMFAKFAKEEFYKEAEAEMDASEIGSYNKDDFFDSMSSDVTERKERPDYHNQRRLDAETFGVASAQQQQQQHRHHRDTRGGGGRGGGRHQGGYQQHGGGYHQQGGYGQGGRGGGRGGRGRSGYRSGRGGGRSNGGGGYQSRRQQESV